MIDVFSLCATRSTAPAAVFLDCGIAFLPVGLIAGLASMQASGTTFTAVGITFALDQRHRRRGGR